MKDPALRSVGYAARGLWIDMLSLMHENDRRGYLQVNGKPVTAEQLARMTGAGAGTTESSTDVVSRLLQELETSGVFSRTEDGTIYCRRQVRDEQKREQERERLRRFRKNGGGSPTQWTAIRVAILKRDEYLCAYCGKTATTVDHVIPMSKGGTEDFTNLVACCKRCNFQKGVRSIQEAGMSFRAGFKGFETPMKQLCTEDEDEVEDEVKNQKKKSEEFNADDLVFMVLRELRIPASNPELTMVVADALRMKGGEPEWNLEKAATHLIERGAAYRTSGIWNTEWKKSWANWFKDQCYDQDPKAWNKSNSRGYVERKKKSLHGADDEKTKDNEKDKT